MSIFKRMFSAVLVVLLFALLVSFLVFQSLTLLHNNTNKLVASRRVAEHSFNLNYLVHDYLINPAERIRVQWDISFIKLEREIRFLQEGSLNPYANKMLAKIADEMQLAKDYFALLVAFSQQDLAGLPQGFSREDLGEVIVVRLLQMSSATFSLESIIRDNFIESQRAFTIWFLAAITLFFLIFIGFIYRLLREIKFRSQSEKSLIVANEKLRLVDRLVEFTGDAVYRYSYDEGVIVYANQGFVDLLELDSEPSQVVGKTLDQVFCYLQKPGTLRRLTKERGEVRNYPYNFKTLTGREKWVLHNSFLVEDKDGKKILEAITTDITERRAVEERNRFLAGILDSAPLSVVATDKARKIVYVNPATEKLYGYKKDELIGKDPLLLNAEVGRQDIEDEILKVLEDNQRVYSRNILNRKKSGETFTAEVNIYQLKDNSGKFIAFVGFQKDITNHLRIQEEIKASELKFKTIFEKAGSAIFVVDPESERIIDCNQRAEELVEMQHKEIVGLNQYQLYPKKRQDKCQRLFYKHVKNKVKGNYQLEVESSQGKIRPVWVTVELLSFGSKKLMVVFFTDLSSRVELEKKEKETLKALVKVEAEHAKTRELKKAYNDLKSMQDKLIRSEKLAALGKLSGIMAHDLRNPLAVIRNSIYILEKKLKISENTKVKEYINLVNEEIDVADSIIEEALGFAGPKRVELTSFDLPEVILKVLKSITIPNFIKIKENLNTSKIEIEGDREQIRRLFTNLIRNAIEAIETKGILTIDIIPANKAVKVEVADTGIGIAKKEFDKIFDPLYSTKVQGIGLGLVACKNIVKAHRGNISIESQRGKGTTVWVTLPYRVKA